MQINSDRQRQLLAANSSSECDTEWQQRNYENDGAFPLEPGNVDSNEELMAQGIREPAAALRSGGGRQTNLE